MRIDPRVRRLWWVPAVALGAIALFRIAEPPKPERVKPREAVDEDPGIVIPKSRARLIQRLAAPADAGDASRD